MMIAKILLFLLLVTGGFYTSYSLVSYSFVSYHERVHERVNELYSLESDVVIARTGGLFPYTGTTTTNMSGMIVAERESLRDHHLTTERFGYHMIPFLQALFIIGYLLTISTGYAVLLTRNTT